MAQLADPWSASLVHTSCHAANYFQREPNFNKKTNL